MKAALERLGHQVFPWQENDAATWHALQVGVDVAACPDLVLWTRTGWDWEHCCGWKWELAMGEQQAAIDALRGRGTPVVGFHLDRWWGLDREGQVLVEPFFLSDVVYTADGGHDEQWASVGINHRWSPPGVLLAECERQIDRRRAARNYRGIEVAFVGSHRLTQRPDGSWEGYHDEWAPQRKAMLDALRAEFRSRFRCLPRVQSLRGRELSEVYAAVPVIVGDSCLAGGIARYWSDRIPETLGRGGLLVHPDVEGLDEHFKPGEHLLTFPQGDWSAMVDQVRWALRNPRQAEEIRRAGRAHVMDHHTYERRVERILFDLFEDGRL